MVPTVYLYPHIAEVDHFAQQWRMPITLKVDVTKAVEGLRELEKTQIRFALARSLTKTAQDAQMAVRQSLGQKFTLRNQFTSQGIRIKPASANGERIEADVHTYTANKKSGASGYMERQEDGGEKVPIGGHAHLAIPTVYLRKYAGGPIPEPLRPKSLLPVDAQEGGSYQGMMGRVVGEVRGRLTQRARKALRQGYVAFIRRDEAGTLCVFVRLQGARDVEPWYILIPVAHVQPRLGMQETVDRAVQANFDKNWQETWRGIYAKGLRVRF